MSKPALSCYLENMPQDQRNPLLSVQFRVPFDRITAADVEPGVAQLLRGARDRLESIVTPDDPAPGIFPGGERTYDDTMRALDELTEPLDYAMGVVRHLESVATYPELRAAFNAVQPEVSAFYTRHSAQRRALADHQVLCRDPRGRATHRRPAPLPAQDHGYLPPPRRGPGPRRQEAAGRDRRRIDAASPPSSARTSWTPPTPSNWCSPNEAELAGLPPSAVVPRARQRRSARARKAGGSPCRRRTTWP